MPSKESEQTNSLNSDCDAKANEFEFEIQKGGASQHELVMPGSPISRPLNRRNRKSYMPVRSDMQTHAMDAFYRNVNVYTRCAHAA